MHFDEQADRLCETCALQSASRFLQIGFYTPAPSSKPQDHSLKVSIQHSKSTKVHSNPGALKSPEAPTAAKNPGTLQTLAPEIPCRWTYILCRPCQA